MNFKYKELILPPLLTMLVACGGSGGFSSSGTTESGDSGEDGSDGGDTGTAVQLALGELSGSTFTDGKITLTANAISSGGQSSLTVSVVNLADSSLYTGETVITFTSPCIEQGLSTTTASTITTTTGIAQTVYTAAGCEGIDTITAQLSSGADAIANITIAPAELGALRFDSASPTTIALKNLSSAGLETVAEVNFKLVDKANNPIKGEDITFSLSDTTGGIELTNDKGITDADGIATAYVNSGTVKTTFRVSAVSDKTPELQATSTNIAIGTGLATQRSITLALSSFNPFSWGIVGAEVTATARVSDYYQNPVPDGTKVVFFASHGQIQSECETSDGVCTVTWTSQSPRPTSSDMDLIFGGNNTVDGYSQSDDPLGMFMKWRDGFTTYDYIGKVAIMASLKGEETTGPDLNGDGLYDPDGETYQGLPEAYMDYLNNGQYDEGEHYIDWDKDNAFSQSPSSTFRGARCTDAARALGHCAALADLFDINYLDMSGNSSLETFTDSSYTTTASSISLAGTGSQDSIYAMMRDVNGNSPAEGSSYSATIETEDGYEFNQFGVTSVTVDAFHRGPYTVAASVYMKSQPDAHFQGQLAGNLVLTFTDADGTNSKTYIPIYDTSETVLPPVEE